jgi:predicted HTH transcriptional regulator
MYPDVAIRELVANALIHQDLAVTGTSPLIELFDDRLEISNPGVPLVDTTRLLDTPPRSRNEAVASMMRRMNVCEERGTGVDKVVGSCELYQLPAPQFEAADGFTRSTLFATRALTRMEPAERIRAVYWHACLRHVNGQHTNNASVRQRFAIADTNSAIASRLLKEAEAAGAIRIFDPDAALKLRRYVPRWA